MKIWGELAGIPVGPHFNGAPGFPSCIEYVTATDGEIDKLGNITIGAGGEYPVAMSYADAIRVYWRVSMLLLRTGSVHQYAGMFTGTVPFGPKLGPIRETIVTGEECKFMYNLVCGASASVAASNPVDDPDNIFVQGYSFSGNCRANISQKGMPLMSQIVYLKQSASSALYHSPLPDPTKEFYTTALSDPPSWDTLTYKQVGECEVDLSDQTGITPDTLKPFIIPLFTLVRTPPDSVTTTNATIKIGYVNFPFVDDRVPTTKQSDAMIDEL